MEDSPEFVLVMVLMCSPLFIYGTIQIIESREEYFKSKLIKDFEKDTQVEYYVCILIELIKKRSKLWIGYFKSL